MEQEQVKIPVNLAKELVADRINSLKGKSLDALATQIVRAVSTELDSFLLYLKDPENFSTEDFAIGGNVLCEFGQIYISREQEHLQKNDLVVELDNSQYFTAKLIDVNFFSSYGLEFQIEYQSGLNTYARKFVSDSYLRSVDLL